MRRAIAFTQGFAIGGLPVWSLGSCLGGGVSLEALMLAYILAALLNWLPKIAEVRP